MSLERESQGSRLTAFQLLMREWSKLAPYNFIHAMRFDAAPDVDRWEKALGTTMAELEIMPAAVRLEQPSTDIDSHLQSELLRPFAETEAPIRFFVLDENEDGHWFGATINHWFADDFSCRILFQQIYAAYRGELSQPGSVTPATMARMPRAAASSWWRDWNAFIKQVIDLRRACRTPMRDPMDFGARIFRVVLPEDALEAGRAMAKRHHGTLHDLFLAATAQAFGARLSGEPGSRRNRIAIASAIDLRRFDAEQLPNRFGMDIGYYIVTDQRPHERSPGELIERIAAQTRRFKADSNTDPHRPALCLWRTSISRRSKATHYSRGAPLVAGLSNVNLTGSWIEQSEIREFRRIGPTGPVVPMVLVITTLRGRIFFDVTLRTAAFAEPEARTLVNEIVQRLPGI